MNVAVKDACATRHDFERPPLDGWHIQSASTLVSQVVETSPGWDFPGPGERVGRFLLLDRLGAGATAVVYSARDLQYGRDVALKVARRGTGGTGSIFAREVSALEVVRHPSVVELLGADPEGDAPWLAMERLDGPNLRAWRRTSASDWPLALAAVIDVGRGLAAAHARGVVHGDVKPENIVVRSSGRGCLIDFGLASSIPRPSGPSQTPSSTAMHQGAGTPAYMAPELYAGDPPDAWSDQFAFCVTCWEAMCGRRPFAGASPASLVYHASNGLLQPMPNGPRLPARLRGALERGLQVRRAARWSSMRTLTDELQQSLPTSAMRSLAAQ